MRLNYKKLKSEAFNLRRMGKTYNEIRKSTGEVIPKSTLSYWFHDLPQTKFYKGRLRKMIVKNIQKARRKALLVNKAKRLEYIHSVKERIKHLPLKLKDKDVAKISLTMLFLGDGSKSTKGSVMFGNSDPMIIKLFLSLLRYCYTIDERKFRCTLQCRADQDIKKLENFWARLTGISSRQFYKARIDPRTIGKPSKKLNYKGVCRIDYFSGDLCMELRQISEMISEGL